MASPAKLDSRIPVSYTHLDVYKRQEYGADHGDEQLKIVHDFEEEQ